MATRKLFVSCIDEFEEWLHEMKQKFGSVSLIWIKISKVPQFICLLMRRSEKPALI